MYRRLLVPLDGSDLAEEALPHALNLAGRLGSELILMRVVVSPYAIVAPDLVLAGTDPNLPALNRQAQQYLDSVAARLPRGIPLRTIVSEGPVAEAILDHAAALDVDLIIMSTHGRGGVSRWVYGSVAERVLQGSACPVLLIRSVATNP
jgi:nucleotide-binding universal stress UspA family protein